MPDAIRDRYSVKIAASLALVFAVTLAIGVLFTLYVMETGGGGDDGDAEVLDDGSDADAPAAAD